MNRIPLQVIFRRVTDEIEQFISFVETRGRAE